MQDYDIIFPKGNETKLIEMAKKLGYKKLYIVYPLENYFGAKKEIASWNCPDIAAKQHRHCNFSAKHKSEFHNKRFL